MNTNHQFIMSSVANMSSFKLFFPICRKAAIFLPLLQATIFVTVFCHYFSSCYNQLDFAIIREATTCCHCYKPLFLSPLQATIISNCYNQ